MKKFYVLAFIFLFLQPTFAQLPPVDARIKAALWAAPEDKRADATVYGYDEKGNIVLLRKGKNEMICVGDDPKVAGLNVSCYHKDLEPFMARGRTLKTQGKSFKEIFDIREAEAKSGKLKMPKQAANLQVFTASEENFNATTGQVVKGNYRYVVYIPWATAASTGLPIKPEAPGMPWIMDPGTHRAHIMIDPPSKN